MTVRWHLRLALFLTVSSLLAPVPGLAAPRDIAEPEAIGAGDGAARADAARRDGSVDDAREIARTCITDADDILALAPDDGAARWDRYKCRLSLGRALYAEGELDGADKIFAAAEADMRAWVAEDPENGWEQSLSVTLVDRGDVARERQDWAAAMRFYQEAHDHDLAMNEADPDDTARRENVANTHGRIASILYAENDLEAARVQYALGLEILRDVKARNPLGEDHLRRLAIMLNDLGDIERDSYNFEDAAAAYDEALGLLRDGVRRWPRSGDIVWHLANLRYDQGELLELTGDDASAARHYEEAAMHFAAYQEIEGETAATLLRIFDSLFYAADAERRAGDLSSARRHFEDTAPVFRRLVAHGPADPSLRRKRAVSLYQLAQIALEFGDHAAADTASAEDLAISLALLAEAPADLNALSDAAYSYELLGRVRFAEGDIGNARAALEQGLALRRTILQADPENAIAVVRQSQDLRSAFRMLAPESTGGAALPYLSEARAELRDAFARQPDHYELSGEYSLVLAVIGEWEAQQGQLAASLATYQDALKVDKAAAVRWPDDPEVIRYLAISQGAVAGGRFLLDQYPAARADYRATIAIWQDYARFGPDEALTAMTTEAWAGREIGLTFESEGDLPAAIEAYREAVARSVIFRATVGQTPASEEEHMHNLRFLGVVLSEVADYEAARAPLLEAARLAAELGEAQPDNASLRWSGVNALWWLAENSGDPAFWREILARLEPLENGGTLDRDELDAIKAARAALAE